MNSVKGVGKMQKKYIVKVLIIIGFIAVIALTVHLVGGNIINMARNHLGI